MKTITRLRYSAALIGLAAAGTAAAQDVKILQPGAPGQDAKVLTAQQAVTIADTRFTEDDVKFIRDMIPHHYQATQMSALVKGRTNNPDIIALAGRIDASQADEIAFMQGWLTERRQPRPDPAAHSMMDMSGVMAGMASPVQMAALANAKGAEFDRQFLSLMIPHHAGAVAMVEQLQKKSGSLYDPVLFDFTNEIMTEQKSEIERMTAMLGALSADPRASLTAGFRDAGEAANNMVLVASLPKPDGFFDPANPTGIAPKKPAKEEGETPQRGNDVDPEAGTVFSDRSPLLNFMQSDMAFSGDVLVTGNFHGFNIYKLSDSATPQLVSSIVCPGGQGDVSIVGNMLIMSVEQTRARTDCGGQGIDGDVSPDRFRGLRIFDISDLTNPRQVGQVQTCRGSHTHSVVSSDETSIVVYNSGTAGVRPEKELAGCIGDVPGDDRTALFRIDVIEIPLADPSKSRIIDSPAVFADPETGRLAGLWLEGDHGEGTQETSTTDQCHDITVFPARNLAAGACSGNGIIFDISDPRAPKRIDEVIDKGFAYWHSATFNNDGTKVIFTDEWGGGTRPRCRVQDPRNWGADAIYDIKGGELTYGGTFKLPAAQGEKENCVAHNGSIIPVPGRDIFVQAWYQGGVSVIDFTDSANPKEIAYFDRGPVSDETAVVGGYWSTYWYNGKIYGTEIARGLDVLELTPSEHLSENEIAAAKMADMGSTFNPQQQFPVSWPHSPVVAMAYVDQLARSGDFAPADAASLIALIRTADAHVTAGHKDGATAAALRVHVGHLVDAGAGSRKAMLAAAMETLAAKLG
ncbi:DUF305 domain-containing protein [Altererythrobacter aquiaggeris]|uniref:DUF305 domain-containing protein n=1 Tax=Aestuarierythrobacter aquiaggeris TaxID=1898396 RepID=UPI0030190CEB